MENLAECESLTVNLTNEECKYDDEEQSGIFKSFITYENYRNFTQELACNSEELKAQWEKQVKLVNFPNLQVPTFTHRPISQFDIKWLQQEDTISINTFDQESANEIMTSGIDMMSCYCFELFGRIFKRIEDSPNKEGLNIEFDFYRNKYQTMYAELFVQIEENKRVLNIFNESLTTTFDWIVAYCATAYSSEMFKILMEESGILQSYMSTELLLRKTDASASLLYRILCSNCFEAFVELIGKQKMIELLFLEKTFLICMMHKNTLIRFLTGSSEEENNNIFKSILSSTYENGENILHVILKFGFENLTHTVASSTINALVQYKSLIDIPNVCGVKPYEHCKNMSDKSLSMMINSNLLSLHLLLMCDENKLPVLYDPSIADYMFEVQTTPFKDDKTVSQETLEEFAPTLVYYIYNNLNDVDENYDFTTIDEICNLTSLIDNYMKKLVTISDLETFLLKEVRYYNGKKYPIIYYLFAISAQECIFNKNVKNNAYDTFSSILQKYPFLLPYSQINTVSNTGIECTCTIQKLIEFGNTEYVKLYFECFLQNNNLELDHYLSNHSGINFLQTTLQYLDITSEPYNIIKIFLDFASHVATPQNVIDSITPNTFKLILTNSINMYIINHLDYVMSSVEIAKPLFEWLYAYNPKEFILTLNSFETWPKYFTDSDDANKPVNNYELYTFIETQIITSQTKIPIESIIGTNLDDYPSLFTKFSQISNISNRCNRIYTSLIQNGHFADYYAQNFNVVYNLLCLRDVTITKALQQLPSFSSDIFYEQYEDVDLFRQSCDHQDLNYCKYILDTSFQTLEYKQSFVKSFDVKLSYEISLLLLQKGMICYMACESVENYIKIVLDIINVGMSLETFSVEELNNLFSLEVTPAILITLSENSYVEVVCNQLEASPEFRNMVKTHENYLSCSLCKTKNKQLIASVIRNNILSTSNIVPLLVNIVEDTELFKFVLNNYNILELLREEEELAITFKESFLNKIFVSDSFAVMLEWASCELNCENVNLLITYCLEKECDILSKFVAYSNENQILQLTHLLLSTDKSLITPTMIEHVIKDNQKDLLIKCIQLKVNGINDFSNMILEKYPDVVLVFENTRELITHMNDSNLLELFRSSRMSIEIQDFIFENLLAQNKLNVLGECLLGVCLSSPFIELQEELISKLIETNNEIYYSFMKNNICVDKYLLMTDQIGNYMLPFVPNGYISEELVKTFVLMLSIDDLTKCDKFGRSIFNNLMVDPFFKFVLERPDIGEFYEKNIQILQRFLNDIARNHSQSITLIPSHISNTIFDNLGKNIPMLLLEHGNYDYALEFLKALDKDALNAMLEHVDLDGCNLLFYAVVCSDTFDDIFDMYLEHFGEGCVKKHNNAYETILMYSIKHGKNFEDILANDKFGQEQNYVYKNTGSILTYGAKYLNESQFESLLRWKHIAGNHLDVTNEFKLYDWFSGEEPWVSKSQVRGSLLTVASYYSGQHLKNILKFYEHQNRSIKIILEREVVSIGKKNYSLIEFAFLYNPESFQHLLGLPFVTEIKLNHEFFRDNYDVQPASWFHYTKSKYYVNTTTSQYQLSYNLRPEKITSIASIVQAKQECASSIDDMCGICNVGKKKIMFGCHLHLACVKCGCVRDDCPECRTKNSSQKIKIFD